MKTIQEEKTAAQLEMAFEELVEDLGEKVADGTSPDDETTMAARVLREMVAIPGAMMVMMVMDV